MNEYARGEVVEVPVQFTDLGVPYDPSVVTLVVRCSQKPKVEYTYPAPPIVRTGVGEYQALLATAASGIPGLGSGTWVAQWCTPDGAFGATRFTVEEPVLLPIWLVFPTPTPQKYGRSVTDTATASDSVHANRSNAFATDVALASDSVPGPHKVTVNLSDTALASDSATATPHQFQKNVSDQALASDVAGTAKFLLVATDAAFVSDALARTPHLLRQLSDTAHAIDAFSRHPLFSRALSDTAHASDVLTGPGGNKLITPNFQSGSTYTIQASDAFGAIYMTSSGDNTVTLNASVLSVGQWVLIVQFGAGPTQITNGAGVTITSASITKTTLQQYAQVMLHVDASNNANLTGSLGA